MMMYLPLSSDLYENLNFYQIGCGFLADLLQYLIVKTHDFEKKKNKKTHTQTEKQNKNKNVYQIGNSFVKRLYFLLVLPLTKSN